jgi:hypothetical protein
MGLRVEHGRVAVRVDEGLGQRAGRDGVQFLQHALGGVQIDAVGAEVVLHAEDLEEVELEVTEVALEVAHRSLQRNSSTVRPPCSYRPVTTAEDITRR